MRIQYSLSEPCECLTPCPYHECYVENGNVVRVMVASTYCTEECTKFLDQDDEEMTVECKGDTFQDI